MKELLAKHFLQTGPQLKYLSICKYGRTADAPEINSAYIILAHLTKPKTHHDRKPQNNKLFPTL
jgi:hypothetical protein